MNLPTCRHRGAEKSPGFFACTHPRLIVHPGGVPASACMECCSVGIFCDQPHGKIVAITAPAPPRNPCVYLGTILQRSGPDGIPCDCAFKWLRKCEIHGECSLTECGRKGVAVCQSCADHDDSAI